MRSTEVGVQRAPGCAGVGCPVEGPAGGRVVSRGEGARSRFVLQVALGLEDRRECVGIEGGGVVLTAALG